MYWDGASTIIKNGEKIDGKIHQYTIKRLINDGASIVYEAERSDSKKIFLKHFQDPNQYQDDWDEFLIFQHSVLKRLLQLPPHLIEINYEYFEYYGYHFQAKAFEENAVTLNNFIYNTNRPDLKTRFSLAVVLAGIVKQIHKTGIVHSDLKPDQFIIIDDGSIEAGIRAKLIDFDHCAIPSLGLYLTAGTEEWMSPEHVHGENISFNSDIFSLGQILYTLLTNGKQPYSHSIENGTYEKDILNRKGYQSLNHLFKGKLPQEISDIVDSMMEPNASKRPLIDEVHKILVKHVFETKTSGKKNNKSHLVLKSNGKSRIVAKNETITRDIVKGSFGNHYDFYTKQFELFRDNSNQWFIKGLAIPSNAKNSKGESIKLYKTLYNGEDATGKFKKIENGGEIKVGNTLFTVEVKE